MLWLLLLLLVWVGGAVLVLGVLAAVLWLEDRRDARRDRRPGFIIDGPERRS